MTAIQKKDFVYYLWRRLSIIVTTRGLYSKLENEVIDI